MYARLAIHTPARLRNLPIVPRVAAGQIGRQRYEQQDYACSGRARAAEARDEAGSAQCRARVCRVPPGARRERVDETGSRSGVGLALCKLPGARWKASTLSRAHSKACCATGYGAAGCEAPRKHHDTSFLQTKGMNLVRLSGFARLSPASQGAGEIGRNALRK